MFGMYFPFDLSPKNWALTMEHQIEYQNALKISFKSNYVKLYNLCNLLVHKHQSQLSDSY